MTQQEIASRLGLNNGQFFAENRYKNLWWFIDGKACGYGDLREEDILRIQNELVEGEEFVGWNEHHMGRFHQTDTPMIRITPTQVLHRTDIVEAEGR